MVPSSRGLLDPVIEAYKKDIDRTLLRENLKLSVERSASRLRTRTETPVSHRGVTPVEAVRFTAADAHRDACEDREGCRRFPGGGRST